MNIVKHHDLNTPHGSSIIWRYMELEKFLDLLINKRLFFTNANNFTDSYEISLPQNLVKSHRKRLMSEGFIGRDLDEEIARFEYTNRPMRDLTLVNCWSLGRNESYALWKIYLGGSKAGVAIRTNFSRLKKSISSESNIYPEDIYAGVVQYRDFLSEHDLSRFKLVTTKREFYSYENEVRLFILHFPGPGDKNDPPYDVSVGRHISINLDTLIDQIYLSPFLAKWSEDAIKKIIKKISPSLVHRLTSSSIRDQ